MIWLDNSDSGNYPAIFSAYSMRSLMFLPAHAEMPNNNYASYDMINESYAIKFASSGNNRVGFTSVAPADFTNALDSKLTLNYYLATTGLFGENANWQVYFEGYGDHVTTSGVTTFFSTPYSGTYGFLQHGTGYISDLNVLTADYPFKMYINCDAVHDIYLVSAILKIY
jgi:hypothetical protein